MITRYALFEGKVKEGKTDAFRKAVIEMLAGTTASQGYRLVPLTFG